MAGTHATFHNLLDHCRYHANAQAGAMYPTFKHAHEVAGTLRRQIKAGETYNETLRQIRFPNGSVLNIFFEEMTRNLLSVEFTDLYLHPDVRHGSVQEVITRLRPAAHIAAATGRHVDAILARVKAELARSFAKHGGMASPHEGSSVIREEFEELWEHVRRDTGKSADAIKEAAQLAAMAVKYILSFETRTDGN